MNLQLSIDRLKTTGDGNGDGGDATFVESVIMKLGHNSLTGDRVALGNGRNSRGK